MKTLYVNGCSLTAGIEIKNQSDRWANILNDHYFKRELYNDALGAGSNHRIVRTSINWIANYLKQNKSDNLFVIIGWTYSPRWELYKNQKWKWYLMADMLLPKNSRLKSQVDKNISKFYFDHIMNSYYMNYEDYKNMFNLKLYLNFNKISYMFFHAGMSDDFFKNHELIKHFKNIQDDNELVNLYNLIYDKNFLTEYNYYTYSVNNNFKLGKGNHPLEDGNRAWAKVLEKYIKDNNLI